MTHNMNLLQAMTSKICHDLANSLNVINLSLELADNHSTINNAKRLLINETNHLIKQVVFFRKTYGLIETRCTIPLVIANSHFNSFCQDHNITFQVYYNLPATGIIADVFQAICCLISIAIDNFQHEQQTIPKGSIKLHIDNNSESIKIQTIGRQYFQATNIDILNTMPDHHRQGESDITIANCREYYVVSMCQQNNYTLHVNVQQQDLDQYDSTSNKNDMETITTTIADLNQKHESNNIEYLITKAAAYL